MIEKWSNKDAYDTVVMTTMINDGDDESCIVDEGGNEGNEINDKREKKEGKNIRTFCYIRT